MPTGYTSSPAGTLTTSGSLSPTHAGQGRGQWERATAEGFLTPGTAPGANVPEFERLTASSTVLNGGLAAVIAEFEQATAAGYGPPNTDISFEAATASATLLAGSVGASDVSFDLPALSTTVVGGSVSLGTSSFQAMEGDAASTPVVTAFGSASLERLRATATLLVGGYATASPSFGPLSATTAQHAVASISGSVAFARTAARGMSNAVMADTFQTFAMNVDGSALTTYTNYDFNSFADFAGAQWGAGPGGIMRLDGSTDDGDSIAWVVRTGMLDDKSPQLKRLDEVVLSMRFDGPIRVRVWTDDDTYYDTTVLNYRPGVIQQARARAGKGAKSRFFRVELAGLSNTYVELSGMNLPFYVTKRRIG